MSGTVIDMLKLCAKATSKVDTESMKVGVDNGGKGEYPLEAESKAGHVHGDFEEEAKNIQPEARWQR